MKKLLLSMLLSAPALLAESQNNIIQEIKEDLNIIGSQITEMVTSPTEVVKDTIATVADSQPVHYIQDTARISVKMAQDVANRSVQMIADAKDAIAQSEIMQVAQEVAEELQEGAQDGSQAIKDTVATIVAATKRAVRSATDKTTAVTHVASEKLQEVTTTVANSEPVQVLAEVSEQLAEIPSAIISEIKKN